MVRNFYDICVLFQTIDAEFNIEERKFKNLDAAVKVTVRNVAAYLDQLQV